MRHFKYNSRQKNKRRMRKRSCGTEERGFMAGKNKNGFRTVGEAEAEEYRIKIREHRLKILKRTAIALLILLLAVMGGALFMAFRQYSGYDVLSSVQRSDTMATKFDEFQGNIIKYSNDGAFYLDTENELIWNQTYEMSNPKLDMCEQYLVIYDKKGTQIYILTKDGLQGSIETIMPIRQVCVAAQGTVAVLMENSRGAFLALYGRDGSNLVSGEIHGEQGGYPVAIALSRDAVKLAVSMLNVNDGTVKSTVAFYNYSSIGQNEIDNCVGVVSFAGMVIPELRYTAGDKMTAFGDSKIAVFDGAKKPQLITEIPIEKEAQSIFYNENYMGLVYDNEDEAVTKHLIVCDIEGKIVMEKDFSMDYTDIEFLSNDEVCIRSETVCDIYTLRGVHKFHYEFDRTLHRVIPGGSDLNYTFVLSDVTEKVRLK